MNVKFQIDAPLVVQFNTNVTTPFLSAGYGAMTIVSPATAGTITVPPQIVSIPPAKYIYSIGQSGSGYQLQRVRILN